MVDNCMEQIRMTSYTGAAVEGSFRLNRLLKLFMLFVRDNFKCFKDIVS